jgi:hypothetical protein
MAAAIAGDAKSREVQCRGRGTARMRRDDNDNNDGNDDVERRASVNGSSDEQRKHIHTDYRTTAN